MIEAPKTSKNDTDWAKFRAQELTWSDGSDRVLKDQKLRYFTKIS